MTIYSTKGLKIYLEKTGATKVSIKTPDVTAITSAKPPVVTVTTVAGIQAGDIVTVANSGIPEADGTFVVGAVVTAGNTFTLVGADTTNTTGTLDTAKVTVDVLPVAQMENICASSVSFDVNVPSSLSVGTFCSPTQSIPSVVVEAGNMTLGMYHDVTSAGFKLLEEAASKGDNRHVMIQWANNQGSMIADGVMSSFSISDLPLDGATAWQATFALSQKPVFRF